MGDWISREDGDLRPSFPPEAFAEAIRVAHEHGAKVTAHCFGHEVLAGLIDAGIDCIEHGTGLHVDQIETMAARGVALVPTVMQLDKFPEYAAAGRSKFPDYTAHHDRPLRRAAATRSWRRTTPGCRCTPGPTAAGSAGTATWPAR